MRHARPFVPQLEINWHHPLVLWGYAPRSAPRRPPFLYPSSRSNFFCATWITCTSSACAYLVFNCASQSPAQAQQPFGCPATTSCLQRMRCAYASLRVSPVAPNPPPSFLALPNKWHAHLDQHNRNLNHPSCSLLRPQGRSVNPRLPSHAPLPHHAHWHKPAPRQAPLPCVA